MSKLVVAFKHKVPTAIGIPGKGLIYPTGDMVTRGSFNGRAVSGMEYDFDKISTIDLKPENPEEMPASLRGEDPEFIKAYKVSQAGEVAKNIKANEEVIKVLKSHENAGNIEYLGRAHVDQKGKVTLENDKRVIPASEVVAKGKPVDTDTPKPEVTKVPAATAKPKPE